MSLLTKLWRLVTLRCMTCGSWEHVWHSRSAIPRAWLVDGLAMSPGPDMLYRAVLDGLRCDHPQGHPLDCSCDALDPPSYACHQCGSEGHCRHRCQMIGWCHECDGDLCGGGCRDVTCQKHMLVKQTGKPGWELYPNEWPRGGQ